jgi:hypothetical protein
MFLLLSVHKKDPPSGRAGGKRWVLASKSPYTSLPTIGSDTFKRVTIKGGQRRNLQRC